MGCDIHAHLEIQVAGEWYYYAPVKIDRNYTLFSRLADVRNNLEGRPWIKPICEPRGLPPDITPMTQLESNHWASDGFCHSWFFYEEIEELIGIDWDKIFMWTEYKKTHKEIQSVRLVFWFDN